MRARSISGFFWLRRLAAASLGLWCPVVGSFALRRPVIGRFGLRRPVIGALKLHNGALGLHCLLLVALMAGAGGCHSSNPDTPHILIQTQAGDIEVELYPKQAPKTAGAFLSYMDSGFYKNGSFYRVLNEDNQVTGAAISKLIQGGIWKTNHAKAAGLPGVPHETTQQTHILHKNGTISLARSDPGSATTEFFICVGDQPGFDFGGENNPDGQGYAAFGKVVRGMDVVSTLYARPENNQSFTPSIPIFNIVRK